MLIFLNILKIIGLILLGILGFVLCLVLLVLIVPVRYRVDANNDDSIEGRIKVTWLLHFVSVSVTYKKALDIKLKILGINFLKKKSEKKEKDIESELEDREPKNKKVKEKKSKEKKSKDKKSKDDISNDNKSVSVGTENDSSKPELNIKPLDITDEKEDAFNQEESKSFFNKIKAFCIKIYNFIVSIPQKFEEFLENASSKLDEAIDTVDYYSRILDSKGTESVIEYVKLKIIKLLKHIRPRKCKAEIRYGSTDPEKIGKICSYYGIATLFLPKNVYFYPDFDEDYFKFKGYFKGRIILGYVAIWGLGFLLNKKLKKFIKLMKREKHNGR